MRIALGIEYDGREFSGWQIQLQARTVQQVLESALANVAAVPVRVRCAGRTDTGVHAVGQVAHFDTALRRSERAWVLGTTSNLPRDVSVVWAREVPAHFDARFSACARVYRYLILNRRTRSALLAGRATWELRPLAVERMQEAARYLLGRHDFSSYRAVGCQARTAVRTVRRLELERYGDLVTLEIEADAFLMHMVRNIAGVLMHVGSGRAAPEWAREVLELRDRARGGVTAPPDGLYLTEVRYPQEFALPRARRAGSTAIPCTDASVLAGGA
ncbi:MAG: tRNA pseudouridine(38-40) synthase TruA [Gammaproteobacteria bacterium]|nr:tRNA pseudouridine(38-40) synthase TruA [Gammaproteobacteria bacterium]